MKKLYSVRTIILAGTLLLQLSTLCFHSRGAAGDVDLSFDPGSGVNGTVTAVALQPNGKVIIGGSFTTVKGLLRTNIARLNADGSGDTTFNPGTGATGSVSSVAVQSDGKVLVGRGYGILRLNSDGGPDTNFNANAYLAIASTERYYDFPISTIVVQPDGTVLVGGDGIFRLNSNGSLDSSFNPGTGSLVYSMALQSDGKVIIGGDVAGGSYGLARLNANGSLDNSFIGGLADLIYSIALQSDGKVLVGHYLGIVRLNANGSLDNSFNLDTGAQGAVNSVVLQPNGKVLIGGSFTTVNGTNRNRIARLNADGSLDSSFNPGTGINAGVSSVVAQSDGKVLVGGSFTTVNGTNRNRMARLNADGSLDDSFHSGRGLAYWAPSVILQSDGKALVGGVFTFINGTNRYGRARLNADGSSDGTFISNTNFNPDLAAFNDYYDYAGSYSYLRYAETTAVLAQADGKVLIGGYSFTVVLGGDEFNPVNYLVFRCFLARFNADGSPDTSFEPATGNWNYSNWGDSETVSALAVQPDGKVLIGGKFLSVNGTNRNGIARLNTNGSLDSTFDPGTGVTGGSYAVNSVDIQSDGKVLIGGSFTAVNGTNRNGIARLNANGSLDISFNPGTGASGGSVSSIALQPDGKVLIGGSFTTINGTNRNNIARLNANGSLDSSFNPGTGTDGSVLSIVLQSDGNVLIGGGFLTVNGVLRPYVARLYGDSVAPSLNIARSNAFVIVSWPFPSTGFELQQNPDLTTTNWTTPSETVTDNGTTRSITVSPASGTRFYRLFKP